ncbi:MAG: septal ring lytic transglycosylase RlpA family lipoprotein [Gammaproteobacteria bacterium]|nr:septal ring lytic transglycosylase RlpA family lipoprotein [Gammaproteobacteria bacterium]|tara:strand:+ start:1762 stop:2469 length:708 start_codon:yes stop_codon:yes gene_type:complete
MAALLLIGACGQLELRPAEPKRSLPPGHYEVFGEVYQILDESRGYVEIGVASWYGGKFHGRRTANGETYDMYSISAAHKSLPLPTFVRVTNLDNGRKLTVRVNDRGPFHDDRLIDLSFAAAEALGFANQGTAPVVVEALDARNYPEEVAAQPTLSFYLQAGAFSQETAAAGLRQRLRGILADAPDGADVHVLVSELETGNVHKVWVGPLAGTSARTRVADQLRETGIQPIEVRVE